MCLKKWSLTCVMLATSLALAAPASAEELGWESLEARAMSVWQRGAGEALARTEAGLVAQRGRLPGRWQNIQLTTQIETPGHGAATWSSAEHVFNALASVQLGALPDKRAQLLEREILTQRAQRDLEAWTFVEEVRLAYHAWWYHAAMVEHLEEDLANKQAELEPLRAAAQQQLISALDMLDLEAELGLVSAEVADAARQRDVAQAQLIALLGDGYTLTAPEDLHSMDLSALERENPWTECLDKLAAHPALRALARRRERALAESELWDHATPWQLQLGPQIRTRALEESWIAAYVSVTIPLSNFYASDAIASRAQADALEAEARWEAARLGARLSAEAQSWRAQVEHIRRLERDLLGPTRARQELLEQAWGQHQVPLERVLRGRRQLHEAEHMLISARAALYLVRARAVALARHLSAPEVTR
jgi:outer membrane protein TolC